jgi:hypothetical protein
MLTKATFLLLKPGAFNAVLAAASFTQMLNNGAGILMAFGALFIVGVFMKAGVALQAGRDHGEVVSGLIGGLIIGAAPVLAGALLAISGFNFPLSPQPPQ